MDHDNDVSVDAATTASGESFYLKAVLKRTFASYITVRKNHPTLISLTPLDLGGFKPPEYEV